MNSVTEMYIIRAATVAIVVFIYLFIMDIKNKRKITIQKFAINLGISVLASALAFAIRALIDKIF